MFTDKQIFDIVNDIVIISDTREKKNQHILDYFTENKIKYKIDTLDTGDYTLILPNYPELGLDKHFLIEKKNSLSEISGNFGTNRDRFAREFERVKDRKMNLLIENATWTKIFNGTYTGSIHPNSLTASLIGWSIKYDFKPWFCKPAESGRLIYWILRMELIEHLKGEK